MLIAFGRATRNHNGQFRAGYPLSRLLCAGAVKVKTLPSIERGDRNVDCKRNLLELATLCGGGVDVPAIRKWGGYLRGFWPNDHACQASFDDEFDYGGN